MFQEKLEKAKNANVEKVISAKFELGASSTSNASLMTDSQNTDSSNKYDDRLKKAICLLGRIQVRIGVIFFSFPNYLFFLAFSIKRGMHVISLVTISVRIIFF